MFSSGYQLNRSWLVTALVGTGNLGERGLKMRWSKVSIANFIVSIGPFVL